MTICRHALRIVSPVRVGDLHLASRRFIPLYNVVKIFAALVHRARMDTGVGVPTHGSVGWKSMPLTLSDLANNCLCRVPHMSAAVEQNQLGHHS